MIGKLIGGIVTGIVWYLFIYAICLIVGKMLEMPPWDIWIIWVPWAGLVGLILLVLGITIMMWKDFLDDTPEVWYF